MFTSVSHRDPRGDGGDQSLPGDRPYHGQSPDRVPLLHPVHAGRGGALHTLCLHGICLQVHGQSHNLPAGNFPSDENSFNDIPLSAHASNRPALWYN